MEISDYTEHFTANVVVPKVIATQINSQTEYDHVPKTSNNTAYG